MIPCQCCHQEFPRQWTWYVCNECGFRVCVNCLGSHQGQYGGGFKCSQCAFGQMEQKSEV